MADGSDTSESPAQEHVLRDAAERFGYAFENAAIGMALATLEGRFFKVNRAMCELVGRSEPELLALGWQDVTFPEDLPAQKALVDEVLTGGAPSRRLEKRYVLPDGRTVWALATFAPVRGGDGTPLYMFSQVVDLTDRKVAYNVVREAYRFEAESAERLRELDELKNAFLAAASHDLRSPLGAIIGSAAVLEDMGDRFTLDQARELIGVIRRSGVRLEHLLSALLDLDRLSRGDLRPVRQATDVEAVVRKSIEQLRITDREVEQDAAGIVAMVDELMLDRIVENLVANASKYAPTGTRITVRAWKEGDSLALAVEDEGAGVADAEKERIFVPHRRGDDVLVAGFGIGLYLVAKFAALHGGRAWVEDRPAGGASFRVTLPAS